MPHVKTSHSSWPTSVLFPYHLVLLTTHRRSALLLFLLPHTIAKATAGCHHPSTSFQSSETASLCPGGRNLRGRPCLAFLPRCECNPLIWGDFRSVLFQKNEVVNSVSFSLLRGTESPFSWDVSSIAPRSHLCRYKPVLTSGPHTGHYLTWRRASVPDHVDFGNQLPWHTDASMLAPRNMAIGETCTGKF